MFLPHEANTALDSLIDLFHMTQLINSSNSKSYRAIRKPIFVKIRINKTQRQHNLIVQFILPLVELYCLYQNRIDRVSDLNRIWILKLSVYRIWIGF